MIKRLKMSMQNSFQTLIFVVCFLHQRDRTGLIRWCRSLLYTTLLCSYSQHCHSTSPDLRARQGNALENPLTESVRKYFPPFSCQFCFSSTHQIFSFSKYFPPLPSPFYFPSNEKMFSFSILLLQR